MVINLFLASLQHEVIQNKLNELFNSLAVEREMTQVDGKHGNSSNQRPFYETQFPELFFY